MKPKTQKKSLEKITCYKCKHIHCIPYALMEYCIERGRWIKDVTKTCRKYQEDRR